jgi:hypothetical protein
MARRGAAGGQPIIGTRRSEGAQPLQRRQPQEQEERGQQTDRGHGYLPADQGAQEAGVSAVAAAMQQAFMDRLVARQRRRYEQQQDEQSCKGACCALPDRGNLPSHSHVSMSNQAHNRPCCKGMKTVTNHQSATLSASLLQPKELVGDDAAGLNSVRASDAIVLNAVGDGCPVHRFGERKGSFQMIGCGPGAGGARPGDNAAVVARGRDGEGRRLQKG